MRPYTFYDLQTGRITGAGLGPEVPSNAIEGHHDGITHYIRKGRVVPFPARPSEHHVWDWEARVWRLDEHRVRSVIRSRRDQLLAASDWTQLPDVPITTREAWAVYRQALRDLTKQPGFPNNIQWPDEPAR
jgi:hypothetical protein